LRLVIQILIKQYLLRQSLVQQSFEILKVSFGCRVILGRLFLIRVSALSLRFWSLLTLLRTLTITTGGVKMSFRLLQAISNKMAT